MLFRLVTLFYLAGQSAYYRRFLAFVNPVAPLTPKDHYKILFSVVTRVDP